MCKLEAEMLSGWLSCWMIDEELEEIGQVSDEDKDKVFTKEELLAACNSSCSCTEIQLSVTTRINIVSF